MKYVVQLQWPQLPTDITWTEVAGVATDSKDRVYVYARGPHRVAVFARDGAFLGSWGENAFVRPHGIFIGPDDAVYCTDDNGHTVQKFTTEGRLLMTLGTRGQHSDTGATSNDYRTIRRSGPPFHYPTNVALAPQGDIYVADGYGNARVHRFTPDGRLLKSWGEPGSGPGQFHVPHGIAVDRSGTVYVADRENSRVQLFSAEGDFLKEWTDVARPCQVCIDRAGLIYVAELGFHVGRWPGSGAAEPGSPRGRVSIFDAQGNLMHRWGGAYPGTPGDFYAPHDICVDSHGDVYVGEVVWSAGGGGKSTPPGCPALQKFTRTPGSVY